MVEQNRTRRRTFLGTAAAGAGLAATRLAQSREQTIAPAGVGTVSGVTAAHQQAVDRQRRIVVNYDALAHLFDYKPTDVADRAEHVKQHLLGLLDRRGSQIDSVGWCWSEGNEAPYPSKVLPTLLDHPVFRRLPEGVDLVRICCDETRKRGIESFFSLRINGGDHDRGAAPKLPQKWDHKERLINWNPDPDGPPEYISPYHKSAFWNFAAEGTRDLKIRALREVAENYDFDGIEVDYARNSPVLPPGQQWEQRAALTEFMRTLRRTLQQVASQRGRPLLIGARVPETVVGCHFDGIDIELWMRERLVDVLTLGCRTMEVDLADFRRLADETGIKLYPCTDFVHKPDGYDPGVAAVGRGIYANWWQQGADAVSTFNYTYGGQDWRLYEEIGSPETLRDKDKVFAIQRRGGGHSPVLTPYPNNWDTPRLAYANTNLLGQLPVTLDPAGRADNLLFLSVADELASGAAGLSTLKLRVGLSRSVPIEVRLNAGLLPAGKRDQNWVEFSPSPGLFAVGKNLVSVRHARPAEADAEPVRIEKVELHVAYR